jgi:hypothetical protein
MGRQAKFLLIGIAIVFAAITVLVLVVRFG